MVDFFAFTVFEMIKDSKCAAHAIFCCKVNRSLSEDAVYEGWEPVPGTITPGSVLNVH